MRAGLFENYSMTLTNNNLSLMTLPCCHSFHDACVIAWLSKAANCPLCRLNSRRLKFCSEIILLPHFQILRAEMPTDDPQWEEMKKQKKRKEKREEDLEALHSSMFG